MIQGFLFTLGIFKVFYNISIILPQSSKRPLFLTSGLVLELKGSLVPLWNISLDEEWKGSELALKGSSEGADDEPKGSSERECLIELSV